MKARGRLRTGEAIYLVAAILLFVLMFFQWYGVGLAGGGSAGNLEVVTLAIKGGDAWQTLEVIPIFLMLAIAVAVGGALLRLVDSDWKPLIPPGAAVCVLGLLASLLILIRIISPPTLGGQIEGSSYSVNLEIWIFFALAAALGIAYGGWRAMADEDSSFSAIGKKLESPRRPTKPRPGAGTKPATRPKS
jgi:hypothetical protein